MCPIVLHHGLMGYDELRLGNLRWCYFHKIDRAIGQLGSPVIISRVHPTASIAERAVQLKECILSRLATLPGKPQRVIVIAHSLGGLDARYMISRLDMADRVAALLTVTSPHRGSPFADWVVRHLDDRLGLLKMLAWMGLNVGAANDLTTAACRRFNDEITDHRAVRYFSIQCSREWRKAPIFAMASHKIIRDAEGDNDGLVSLKSSAWGKVLDHWETDHWQSINRQLTIRHQCPDVSPKYVQALQQVFQSCQ